ncbi:hypothetical protein Tco_0154924 [Tanacetum coccineum]
MLVVVGLRCFAVRIERDGNDVEAEMRTSGKRVADDRVGGGRWWRGSGGAWCGDRDRIRKDRLIDPERDLVLFHRKVPLYSENLDKKVVVEEYAVTRMWELHYLLDKVVSVGTAPGPNSSDHNVNTITNGDGMPRMRTFRETIFPE